jgi:hypothetical protein
VGWNGKLKLLRTIKMKIDYEYMRSIFKIFLENEKPTSNMNDFEVLFNENTNKFVFHIELMFDGGFIKSLNQDNKTGIVRSYIGSHAEFNHRIVEWRLSYVGHDFATALNKKDILNTIKDKFKDEGMSVVADVVKAIVIKQANKYIDEI